MTSRPELCVTVVLPTYNDRDTLPVVLRQLLSLGLPGLRVLVVDDRSPDGTGPLADDWATAFPGRVEVLHRPGRGGLGRAYVAGMVHALADGADVVVQLDADLAHPVAAIPSMIATLVERDAAVVVGSRYVAGAMADARRPRGRTLSRWANDYVDRVLGLGVRDVTSGFKVWSARALAVIDLAGIGSVGYCFQIETAYRVARCGLTVVELPTHAASRRRSRSTLDGQVEAAVAPWRLRRSGWQPAVERRMTTTVAERPLVSLTG